MSASKPHKPRSMGASVLATLMVAALLLARSEGWLNFDQGTQGETQRETWIPIPSGSLELDGAALVQDAFQSQSSDLLLELSGTVQRTLSDDLQGSRHQRFILKLSDGQTLLVAHNIDLAPRVPLQAGDNLSLKGEYEWNSKGGVIHWTHRDPDNRHAHGWILHAGKTYE